VLDQKDGFERDDWDLPGTRLAPGLVSLHGSELHPRQIPVAFGNGVILSCFGMSQVLLVIFFFLFLRCPACHLLFCMRGLVPLAPLAEPEPYLGSVALANSFPGPRQSIFGTSGKSKKKSKKKKPDEKCKHFFSLSVSVRRMTITPARSCVGKL